MPQTEADTCRKLVVPKLLAAGWDSEPHSIAEQRTITDGRIVPVGQGFIRKPPRRVDYLLRFERNFPLAVVEAKSAWKTAGDGLQQAKNRYGVASRLMINVEMVGHQNPCITWGLGFTQDNLQPLEKIVAVRVLPKDLAAFDTTANDIVQCTRGIDAGSAMHV
jgi:hypothetical protein